MRNILKWAALVAVAVVAVMAIGPVDAVAHANTLNHDWTGPLLIGSTLGVTMPNLVDLTKSLDPDGKTAKLAELLNQTNEVLDDMVWVEGNLPTGHRTTVRTGLPTVGWRLLNGGTLPSKSTRAQIDAQCGLLDAWGQVDEKLANLNGNSADFRLSEGYAFIEAMSQEMAQTTFYGNSGTAPEEFTGLSTLYSSLSANNSRCIINGGGSGSDNLSIWLVVWGPNTVHGIYPKGSKGGLQHEDLGLDNIENAGGTTGALLRGYRDHWTWDCGLVLRDWRFAARICNIDVSNLIAESSDADLTKLMTKAVHKVENLRLGRGAWYMNRTAAEFLDIQRQERVQVGGQLGYKEVDGKEVMTFRNIPIRTVDALLETEATVS